MALRDIFLPRFYFRIQRFKRLDKMNSQLVPAMEMLANALKAGSSLTKAMELVPAEMPPPISQEFSVVLREIQLGVSMEKALRNLMKRVQSEEFYLVCYSNQYCHRNRRKFG